MTEIRLGTIEGYFADIIWGNEPLTTRQLVDICAEKLNWKRTTTYTVLKKLCERGIFAKNGMVVTSLMTKDQFHAIQSEQFVERNFHGSLPAFIAAFATRKKLTAEELAEIEKLMASLKETAE